ncbi:hypothetical protein IFR05_012480 [Cadophora sp. M221]|nr:hypothetical protein IFR05_012480 [Cadophora sp. M221]
MVLSLLSNMLHTLQEIFKPQVSASNTLNPTLLAIGQRGYEMQSKYLMIPDQYGLFTSGPPRLQAVLVALAWAIAWVTERSSKRRSPDYVWADWKARVD